VSDFNFTIVKNLTRAYGRDILLRVTNYGALVVGITVTLFYLRQFIFWISLIGIIQALGFIQNVVSLLSAI
jgi:hypothetical protein